MRFAVSLLTILAIASIVGTVLKQNEPYPNYVAQFGQFWFGFFEMLGLYDVYHAAWFIVILTFLILSTSLCIYRNVPGMLREMRSFREHATESSLQHISHNHLYTFSIDHQVLLKRLQVHLTQKKYRFKLHVSENKILLAAKSGSAHRWGYILTHIAIVIICLGGLIDGNIPLKLQQLIGKKIETRGIPQSQVPPESRLAANNVSFRGNVTIPEGSSADVVFLNVGEGYMVQELPFTVTLKKFYIEHYSTGQPKSFASDLIVTDKLSGSATEQTIKVNHPLIYKDVAIYQASFGDGGTLLDLKILDLTNTHKKQPSLQGRIHQTLPVKFDNTDYTLELTDFRPLNVENLTNNPDEKKFRNVGPTFQYKLRNAQGSAKEFNNYMLPLELDGAWYLLSGVRDSPNESFRYLRLPLDEEKTLNGYTMLRRMLFDQRIHPEIIRRFMQNSTKNNKLDETMRTKLAQSAAQILHTFSKGGYDAIADFLRDSVPEEEQEKAAVVYLKLLEVIGLETYQLARQRMNLKPIGSNESAIRFVRDSLNTISDSFLYGSPVYLQLTGFDEVKATGLQLTRSPGKNLVYLGSLLLVLGIFAMFYIHERRLWLLIKPAENKLLLAMSSNRKTLDFEKDFGQKKIAISNLLESKNGIN